MHACTHAGGRGGDDETRDWPYYRGLWTTGEVAQGIDKEGCDFWGKFTILVGITEMHRTRTRHWKGAKVRCWLWLETVGKWDLQRRPLLFPVPVMNDIVLFMFRGQTRVRDEASCRSTELTVPERYPKWALQWDRAREGLADGVLWILAYGKWWNHRQDRKTATHACWMIRSWGLKHAITGWILLPLFLPLFPFTLYTLPLCPLTPACPSSPLPSAPCPSIPLPSVPCPSTPLPSVPCLCQILGLRTWATMPGTTRIF